MSRVLKPAAARAGIGEWVETKRGKRAETWIGCHTFPHTCAALTIVEAGWSLEQVQVFLGHASYQTTGPLLRAPSLDRRAGPGADQRWPGDRPRTAEFAKLRRSLKARIRASPQ